MQSFSFFENAFYSMMHVLSIYDFIFHKAASLTELRRYVNVHVHGLGYVHVHVQLYCTVVFKVITIIAHV